MIVSFLQGLGPLSPGMLAVLIILLLFMRVPVAFAILGPSLLYMVMAGRSVGLAFVTAMSGINSWPLLAVPLFIMVGVVANRAGMADRLFDAALAVLGRVRGGLAYVNISVSVGFSWMSGSALADAAGLGAIEVPAMERRGYPRRFAVGLTAASTVIGPIMPPSIPAIVYASIASVSTGALFIAAIGPALLIAAALSVTVFFWALRRPELSGEKIERRVVLRALRRAIGPVGAPVIILGGILGGWFTPTEAAGVGALYMILLGFALRTLKLRELPGILRDTAMTTASIMIILAASAVLGWILARERVPAKLAESLLGFTDNPIVFLLLVNLMLLLLGMAIEPTSAMVISVPILLPIAVAYGVDPLHFGIIVILNLMIGLLTPPMGGVVYVLSSVTGISVEETFRGVLFFLLPLLAMLALVTYVASVSLWLPGFLGFL